MRTKLFFLTITLILVLGVSTIGLAQIKELGLKDYYLKEYVQGNEEQAAKDLEDNVTPLLRVFGFYSGGGLFHTAKTHGVLGLDVGLRVITIKVGDDLKTEWTGNTGKKGGPLGDQDLIGLPMLHASLGLPMNLEATARIFSYPIGETSEGESSNFTLVGIGLKYGLVQNMLFPRVMIMGSYHQLVVPEEFDFANISTFSVDLVISKGIPMLATFYGGVGVDNSKMKVEFDINGNKYEDDFTTGAMFRGVVGIKLDFIPFMYLNVDYNFGKNQGVNLGLGLSIR